MREVDQLKDQAARMEERIKNLERDARKLPPDLQAAHARVDALNRDNRRQQTEIEHLLATRLDLDNQLKVERWRTFLDAANMAKAWGEKIGHMYIMLEFARELRRAAEGVEDA